MKRHDEYPALKFTCQGGPLDGQDFAFHKGPYVEGGRTPEIARVIHENIRLSTVWRAGGLRVPIAGRYKVEFHEADGTYTATHVPSEMDVYFKAPEPCGPEIAVGEVPPVPQTFGKPILGVIPQPASTLSLT